MNSAKQERESLASRFYRCRLAFAALCIVILVTIGFTIYKVTQSVFYIAEYKIQPITAMQDMTTTICDEMDAYSSLTLMDTRNNQDYRIKKMPDGHCWMMDNLKLATPGAPLTLYSSDSNIAIGNSFTIPDNPVQSPSTHSNGRCDSGGILADGYFLTCDGTSSQSPTNNGFVAYSDPSDPSAAGTESCVARNFIDPASTTGCGYLYNWYTATAGTGTYDVSSGYIESSICPKGWHIPRGADGTTAQNEFAALSSAMHNDSSIMIVA